MESGCGFEFAAPTDARYVEWRAGILAGETKGRLCQVQLRGQSLFRCRSRWTRRVRHDVGSRKLRFRLRLQYEALASQVASRQPS